MTTYDPLVAQSEREAWLAARQTGIGASEVPVLFGRGFISPMRLWAQKTGLLQPEDLTDNEAVKWGILLENIVAEEYERRTGRTLEWAGVLLRSREHPWALATPDYWWWDGDPPRPLPVQIKTAGAFRLNDWAEGPPEAVRLQVQAEMLVTGAPMASVGVLVGGQRFMWADVERDDRTIAEIVERGAEFWRRVQAREVPPMDGSEDETRAVAQTWPRASGEEIALPPDAVEWTEEIEILDGEVKGLTERATALRNMLRASLGNAEMGRFPDGSGWSYGLVQRRGYEVQATSFRQLRRIKAEGGR